MSIDDIKKALVEAKEICNNSKCYACPFGVDGRCRMFSQNGRPISWHVDDWEDSHQ